MRDVRVPKGWISAPLSDLGDWVGGGTPSKANQLFWEGDIPWVSPKDMKVLEIVDSKDHISDKAVEQSSVRLLPEGSVLFVTRSGILAHSFPVAISKVPVTVNQDIKAIIPSENISAKYLAWALRAKERDVLNKCTKYGTTVHSIEVPSLKQLKIGIPSKSEQERIVDKIETLFSELDKGIESLKTAREQLKVYRQAVLKHAFEGKLTAQWREENEVPGWETKSLGVLLSFLTSGSRGWAAYYADEGDIFIRAQNLKYDRLDLEDIAYVSLPEKSEGKRTRVQVGDLLITITGANVTKMGYVKEDLGDAYVSQHVALCRPRCGVNTEFLYWYLIAEAAGREQLNKSAYGAGKPGLNLDNIRSVVVPLPDTTEQNLITLKIKELLSVEENMASTIDNEILRIEALRQSILKNAFLGHIV